MSQVKKIVNYYVVLPKDIFVSLVSNNANGLEFTKFSENATCFSKDEAFKIASDYGLAVLERTVTTTIETWDNVIKVEDK